MISASWLNSIIFIFVLKIPLVSTQNVGLLGLGRTIFSPTCCYACLSTLWGLELSCSQPENTQTFALSTPQCHASNAPYLSSLAYCLKEKCPVDGVSDREIQTCWAQVAGDGTPVTDWETNLPIEAPTEQLSYDATILNVTSLVNGTLFTDSQQTIMAYVSAEKDHALYSLILLIIVVGFCLLLGLSHLKQIVAPTVLLLPRSLSAILDKHLLIPALIGKRNLQALPHNVGYVPQRSISLLIGIYILLNTILVVMTSPFVANDTWYLTSSGQSTGDLSNRLGLLSMANITLSIMFAGRNTVLLYLTGYSRTDLIQFHRWTGRIAVVEAVAHSALYMSVDNSYGTKFFTMAAGIHFIGSTSLYWTFGIAAMVIMILILVFSILPIRIKWYEAFLTTHVFLAIIALVTLWYHLTLRFNKAHGYEVWLYIAFTFWGLDRIVRVTRMLALNWGVFVGRQPAATIQLLPGDEFIKVTVSPSVHWNVKAGQYCFVYFPTIFRPFESHPFSIASWSNGNVYSTSIPRFDANGILTQAGTDIELESVPYELLASNLRSSTGSTATVVSKQLSARNSTQPTQPSISFLIRPSLGLTHRLHSHLLSQSSTPFSLPVLIEGPYGGAPPAIAAVDTVLCIAGGIGITSILSYLHAYLDTFIDGGLTTRTKSMRAARFVIYWAVREGSLVDTILAQLPTADILSQRGVEFTIACSQMGDQRLDLAAVVGEEIERMGRGRLAVVVCGPAGMADDVRSVVGRGAGKVELVVEKFGW